MKTLKNAVETIFNIADLHPQIAARYYGDNIKIDDPQTAQYPLLHVEPTNSTVDVGTMNIGLNITLVDMPSLDDLSSLESQNKTLQILNDVIGDFTMNYTFKQYKVEQPITIVPIIAPEFNDRLVGWSAELTIIVEYKKTGCSDNIINLSTGEFSSAFSNAFNTI